MHRDHKWPGRFLGARDSCGEHCANAMEGSTPSKNNTGEGRLERCHAIREGFFNDPSQDLGAERRSLVNFFGKFFCCDASAGES